MQSPAFLCGCGLGGRLLFHLLYFPSLNEDALEEEVFSGKQTLKPCLPPALFTPDFIFHPLFAFWDLCNEG